MKNKENTKRKLLDAVGKIIRNDGFCGLGVNKVAKTAAVSKILIYRYFGNFNQLLRAYILEMDFWKNRVSDEGDAEALHLSMREQVCKVLAEQFTNFYNHCKTEAMLVNEISNHNVKLNTTMWEENTADQPTYFNVVSTLLLAGTDHLILTEQGINNSPDSGSSLRKTDLLQSIRQIVKWTLW
ncbi:TetR/AcrR family transcriptional regulator [Pedobacter hartonius]|uniref:Transcriptional regulator, TetR family n=1 Tax=Pedobacter hartonius TaxID=425514 RepID=A0A1H3XB57_9SPHI|nr:TetR/AcrR family transcriptional regulator [Pedobacter hartonius]SDZ96171.1 transcriptional regulator, TetR family [Pedobacter hartonius]